MRKKWEPGAQCEKQDSLGNIGTDGTFTSFFIEWANFKNVVCPVPIPGVSKYSNSAISSVIIRYHAIGSAPIHSNASETWGQTETIAPRFLNPYATDVIMSWRASGALLLGRPPFRGMRRRNVSSSSAAMNSSLPTRTARVRRMPQFPHLRRRLAVSQKLDPAPASIASAIAPSQGLDLGW